MNDQKEYWNNVGVTFTLLLPYFRRAKEVFESHDARRYAKTVNYLLVSQYFLLVLLVWLLKESDIKFGIG